MYNIDIHSNYFLLGFASILLFGSCCVLQTRNIYTYIVKYIRTIREYSVMYLKIEYLDQNLVKLVGHETHTTTSLLFSSLIHTKYIQLT